MSAPVTQILRRAAGEIGYSRWTDPNRGTKYARETQPALWPRDTWLLANGISFCDIFVTWVFWKEGLLGILPAGASYNTDYRSSHGGRISKSQAEPGDVLVFDWNWGTRATNHVGILEKTTSHGNPQTIEGNTSSGSSGSQSNGGGVYRRVRRWSQVRYVIRPRWHEAIGIPSGGASVGGSRPSRPWESSPRVQAMSIGEVKRVQQALADRGYDLGKWGVDGKYGQATYNAVRAAQKALGVAVDGIAGPDTMNALTAASKPAAKPAAKPEAPAFPLPRDGRGLFYYGPRSGPHTSISGQTRNTSVPHDVVKVAGRWRSRGLARWQQRMIDRGWNELRSAGGADGRFGDVTEKVVGQFQEAMGLAVDHKIGPATWAAAWEEPVR